MASYESVGARGLYARKKSLPGQTNGPEGVIASRVSGGREGPSALLNAKDNTCGMIVKFRPSNPFYRKVMKLAATQASRMARTSS